MQTQISRRQLLKLGALTAAMPSALGTATARATATAAAHGRYPAKLPVPASWVVQPFENPHVTIAVTRR